MDFNDNYSIALTYVVDTTDYWNFMVFNETTGATISEMPFPTTAFTDNGVFDHMGVVKLSTNTWYSAV